MNSVEGNGKVPLAQETLLLVVLYHLEHLEVLEVPKRVELYDIDRKSYNATDRYWVFITHRGAKFSNTRRARRTKSPLETNVTLHVQVCKFNKGKLKKYIYIYLLKKELITIDDTRLHLPLDQEVQYLFPPEVQVVRVIHALPVNTYIVTIANYWVGAPHNISWKNSTSISFAFMVMPNQPCQVNFNYYTNINLWENCTFNRVQFRRMPSSSMSSIYGADLTWEFVNPVGTFMSVFRDRIQAIKRTSSNIETDVHLYPGKLQTRSAPSLKPVLTWNVTIWADVHDDATEGCSNGADLISLRALWSNFTLWSG